MLKLPQVVFIPIHDNQTKLQQVYHIAQAHFERKEKLIIQVADQASLEFVDLFLWRTPQESFLPHSTDESSQEFLYISDKAVPLFEGHAILNLTLSPLQAKLPLKIIYEFEDLTTPQKKEASQHRFNQYKSWGYPLAIQQVK